MLCVADIREIFYTNLQGKICGVVLVPDYQEYYVPKRDGTNSNGFTFDVCTYFNAGLLLIDLEQYRRHNIEQKCFEWLKQYIPELHDQDTLNAVLSSHIYALPLEWNFFVELLEYKQQNFKDKSKNIVMKITYEEYMQAKNNIKILRYTGRTLKPWHQPYIENDTIKTCIYKSIWWGVAHDTPIFYKDIYFSYMKKQEDALYEAILSLQKHIKSFKLRNRLKRLKQSLKRRCKKLFHAKD